jgi:hypothetical protein
MIALFLIFHTAAFSHDEVPHISTINHKYASQVNWHSLKDALRVSEALKKPLLVDGVYSCKKMYMVMMIFWRR